MNDADKRAAELETLIRNSSALRGKLGEALVIATNVPGIYDHELRVMRDNLNEQIASCYRELRGPAMRFTITLTKTIVVHVNAADEPAARYQALSGETADAAYADGDWQRAETEIKEIQPA